MKAAKQIKVESQREIIKAVQEYIAYKESLGGDEIDGFKTIEMKRQLRRIKRMFGQI